MSTIPQMTEAYTITRSKNYLRDFDVFNCSLMQVLGILAVTTAKKVTVGSQVFLFDPHCLTCFLHSLPPAGEEEMSSNDSVVSREN